jgi:hypothetical protein
MDYKSVQNTVICRYLVIWTIMVPILHAVELPLDLTGEEVLYLILSSFQNSLKNLVLILLNFV